MSARKSRSGPSRGPAGKGGDGGSPGEIPELGPRGEEERDGVNPWSSIPNPGWAAEQQCHIALEPGLKATGAAVFLAS